MTLFKQMALAVSLIIVTMLASVMYINFQSTKDDMVEALYESSVNNISALANRLESSQGDPATVRSIIDAEFDSGYYTAISFVSSDNTFRYKQEDIHPIEGVPAWFVHFINITIKPLSADITSGWSTIGKVTLIPDPTSIYKGLYKTFVNIIYLFFATALLSFAVFSLLLHYILKPLKRIQYQAEAIVNNEFFIIDKEPYTLEFKEVVRAMNAMVKKVEEIFNRANEAAKRNKELLYNDPVTKLFNRRYLMLKIPEFLNTDTKTEGGSIMLIALNGAELLNKILGRQKTDAFFYDFGKILQHETENIEQKVIARVNGTEFTLLLRESETYITESIARHIFEAFMELLQQYHVDEKNIFINIGIYQYNAKTTQAELMTKADDALTKAKADERKHIYVYEDKKIKIALPKERWREIFEHSIAQKEFALKFWPTIIVKEKKILHNVMTFTIKTDNKEFSYGEFIAPAITLGFVSRLYGVVLEKLFLESKLAKSKEHYSVRLSNEFLKDPHSFTTLAQLFKKYAKKRNFTLSFEVADTFAVQNVALLKGFTSLFKEYGYTFGINNFSGESEDFHYLKELSPSFIKAECSFFLDQTEESMNSLDVISKSLGALLIATSVNNENELQELQKRKIETIQGPLTENLQTL